MAQGLGLGGLMLQPSRRHRAAQGTHAMHGVEISSQKPAPAGPSLLPPILCPLGSGAANMFVSRARRMDLPGIKKLDLNESKYPVIKNLKPAMQFLHGFNTWIRGGEYLMIRNCFYHHKLFIQKPQFL